MFSTGLLIVGRDSSVCIATRYGLEGLGIESWFWRDFSHPSRPALGPTQLPIQRIAGLPGGKAAGAWRWPPTPSTAGVKNGVELYIYSPFGFSWPVLGWPLPLPWVIIHKEHKLSLPLRYFIMRQPDEIHVHQVNGSIRNSCSVSFISEYSDVLPYCFTIKYGNTED